jgi:hypothetical protein
MVEGGMPEDRTMRFLLPAMALLIFASGSCAEATAERQAEVRARGSGVMPFSLDAVRHVFEKTADGGLQVVTAAPGHDDQVPMIRAHLAKIASAFARGDFGAPATIHGEDMPGLAELSKAAPADLAIRYRDVPRGGEISYVAKTPELRNAVHRWFDAQLADHGHDATGHRRPGGP